MAKVAVHFGAGKIGRGFLGQLYHESGYAITFVDVMAEVVEALNARGAYPVRLVDEQVKELTVTNVSAVDGRDGDAVAEALAGADIASTAVGVRALPHLARPVAGGIVRRFEQANALPLNIIVCENLVGAAGQFRAMVAEHLPGKQQDLLETRVGFVDASIGRMVPDLVSENEDPLLVCVEPYCELPVNGEAFRGAIPEIAHMKAITNFDSYVEQKLFVHNMSHAATAYLGHLRGHAYIWQAIEDPAVAEVVAGAAEESCRALAAKHGRDLEELRAHYRDLMRRYRNRALGDPVSRVGGDPLRKLGPKDRLTGALRCCVEQHVEAPHIALAIAAALEYRAPEDAGAVELQRMRAATGVEGVLREVCGLAPDSPEARQVRAAMPLLASPPWGQNTQNVSGEG